MSTIVVNKAVRVQTSQTPGKVVGKFVVAVGVFIALLVSMGALVTMGSHAKAETSGMQSTDERFAILANAFYGSVSFHDTVTDETISARDGLVSGSL